MLATVWPYYCGVAEKALRLPASHCAYLRRTVFPAEVDPCAEKGEFDTIVTAGPMFSRGPTVRVGEIVERDGFLFADVIPVGD